MSVISSMLSLIIAFKFLQGNEDCLYLHVWAPKNATKDSKLPVMFWVRIYRDFTPAIVVLIIKCYKFYRYLVEDTF